MNLFNLKSNKVAFRKKEERLCGDMLAFKNTLHLHASSRGKLTANPVGLIEVVN